MKAVSFSADAMTQWSANCKHVAMIHSTLLRNNFEWQTKVELEDDLTSKREKMED